MGGLEPPLTLINLDGYTVDYCQVRVSYPFPSLTLCQLSYISLSFFQKPSYNFFIHTIHYISAFQLNTYVYLLSYDSEQLPHSIYEDVLRAFNRITNNQNRNSVIGRLCTHYQLSIIPFVVTTGFEPVWQEWKSCILTLRWNHRIKNSPISLWIIQLLLYRESNNCHHTCY